MEALITAISSVGFPIVMCIILYSGMTKQITEMQHTINNNTNVMTKLIEKLESWLDRND